VNFLSGLIITDPPSVQEGLLILPFTGQAPVAWQPQNRTLRQCLLFFQRGKKKIYNA
jgi:hypothetical protein